MRNSTKSVNTKGFTLAEVLITLGIIGVVAVVTLPTLIKNYQKTATANRLKETYTMLYQAIRMSELDNGLTTEWTYPENNADGYNEWFNKYLHPYIKHTSIKNADGILYFMLPNGVILRFWNNASTQQVHAYVYLNGIENPIMGKNYFVFYIGYNNATSYRLFNSNKEIRPYDYAPWVKGYKAPSDIRAKLINHPQHGCNNNANKNLCTALIMYDGWKISPDYPW